MQQPDDARVLAFPGHRRSTLSETLEGFPGRAGDPTLPGTRRERRVTMLFSELRGWNEIAERTGPEAAAALLADAVEKGTAVLRSFGAEEVTVGGGASQPVISGVFEGKAHAERAVRAAVGLRETVEADRLPELADHGFRPCTGLNTGAVVETELSGSVPVTYQAVGTIRMFAVRLQEFAGPGQVFLAASTLEAAGNGVKARSIGSVRTNADGDSSEAFALVDVVGESGTAHSRSG
jgi:adenylate cyclase